MGGLVCVSMIIVVRVIAFLKRTLVDSDWPFDNLCGSCLHSQSWITPVGIKLWLLTYLWSDSWVHNFHCLVTLKIFNTMLNAELTKNAEDNKSITVYHVNNTDFKMFKLKWNHKPQEISFTAKFEYLDVISTVDKIIDLGKLFWSTLCS